MTKPLKQQDNKLITVLVKIDKVTFLPVNIVGCWYNKYKCTGNTDCYEKIKQRSVNPRQIFGQTLRQCLQTKSYTFYQSLSLCGAFGSVSRKYVWITFSAMVDIYLCFFSLKIPLCYVVILTPLRNKLDIGSNM